MSREHPEELSRGQPGAPEGQPDAQAPALQEPPPNPAGGKTLIVDANDSGAYPRPSAALKDAGPDDQVFVRPGLYEEKGFRRKAIEALERALHAAPDAKERETVRAKLIQLL